MSPEENIELLNGQVHGLRAVVGALIESHPDRASLIWYLQQYEQVAQAKTEASPVSETYLEAQQEIVRQALAFASIPPAPKAGRA